MYATRRSILELGAALALTACGPATSPSGGSRGFRAVKTARVTLFTSLPAAEADRAAVRAEQVHDAIRALGFPTAAGGRVSVVLFQNRAEYESLLGKYTVGEFVGPRASSGRAHHAAIAVLLDAEPATVLAHELTHHLVYESLGADVPTWLNEGLAEYWSMIDVRDGTAYLGLPLTEREIDDGKPPPPGARARRRTPLAELVPPSALARTDEHDFYGAGGEREERRRVTALYLSSWLFVHLGSQGPADMRKRFTKLVDGVRGFGSTSGAYAAAFGDLDPKELDAAFFAWAKRKDRPFEKRPYMPPPVEIIARRELDREDAGEIRALFR
ncbi:MAG TPA: hypothetical protein VGM56_17160 [Byssovorax sp.]|jgi:hypothetical protein